MSALLLAILLQTTSIRGSIEPPIGAGSVSAARVVLLPQEYAKDFNADAQERIDNFWERFKSSGLARTQKELFIQYMPIVYEAALESVVADMRRDSRINFSNLVTNASQGRFEFRTVAPGEYKLVATATLKGVDYVWTETVQVQSGPLTVQMKTHVP